MSDISGQGYGSSHDWQRGHTNQFILGEITNYSDKATAYTCKKCGASFNHNYDVITDIFQAIEVSGILNQCPNPLPTINRKKE